MGGLMLTIAICWGSRFCEYTIDYSISLNSMLIVKVLVFYRHLKIQIMRADCDLDAAGR